MEDRYHSRMIQFLQHEFLISDEAINMALKHPDQKIAPFQMILWQYGLLTIEQLSQTFDWLSEHSILISE